jgi:hypothetical protein
MNIEGSNPVGPIPEGIPYITAPIIDEPEASATVLFGFHRLHQNKKDPLLVKTKTVADASGS